MGAIAHVFWPGEWGRQPHMKRASRYLVISRASPAIAKTSIPVDVSEVHCAYSLAVSRAWRIPRAQTAALRATPCHGPLHCKPLRCIFHVRVNIEGTGPMPIPHGHPKHLRDIAPDVGRRLVFRGIALYRFQGLGAWNAWHFLDAIRGGARGGPLARSPCDPGSRDAGGVAFFSTSEVARKEVVLERGGCGVEGTCGGAGWGRGV